MRFRGAVIGESGGAVSAPVLLVGSWPGDARQPWPQEDCGEVEAVCGGPGIFQEARVGV